MLLFLALIYGMEHNGIYANGEAPDAKTVRSYGAPTKGIRIGGRHRGARYHAGIKHTDTESAYDYDETFGSEPV